MGAELALLQQIKNGQFKGIARNTIFPKGTKTFETLGKMFKDTENVFNAKFNGALGNASPLSTATYTYTVPMQHIVIGNYMYIVVGSSDPALTNMQVVTVKLETMEIIDFKEITVSPSDKVYIAANKAGTEFSIVYTKSMILGKVTATINQTTFIPTLAHIKVSLTNAPSVLFAGYLNADLIIAYSDGTANTTYICKNSLTYATSIPETITNNINGYIINNALFLGNYSLTISGGVLTKTLATPALTNVICLGYKNDGSFYYVKGYKIYFYNIVDSTSTDVENGKFLITAPVGSYATPCFASNGFIQSSNDFNYIINTETNDCKIEAYFYYKFCSIGNIAVNIAFNTVTGKAIQYHKYAHNNSYFMYSTARINPAFFESVGDGFYLNRSPNHPTRYFVQADGSPQSVSGWINYLIATPICALFGGVASALAPSGKIAGNGLYFAIYYNGSSTASSSLTLDVNVEV